MTVSLLWFRQDLRLADQPALLAAMEEGAVVPVYVLDDEAPGRWRIGGAQRWWLHHSLVSLATSLAERGSRLVLRRGRAATVLAELARELDTQRVHAVRHYEPWWQQAERELGERLDLVLHDGNQLAPPRDVRSQSGEPFKIYGAFWRALQPSLPPHRPLQPPSVIPAPERWPEGDRIEDWRLLPTQPNWASRFGEDWTPGEAGAQERLGDWAAEVGGYERRRNLPGEEGTSRLSPHLHHGELSPAQLWHAIAGQADSAKFLKELAWRDFATVTIARAPDYGAAHGRPQFERMGWRTGPAAEADFRAWTKGRTGYPIVDAGMRQLWATGWMHNRVRMIAASFLVKHLLVDWRRGLDWFWDTLVDADYGNNAVNWQWIAGSGTDSNVWSRIMAPLLQSEKFDAGSYIRNWVPELAGLPDSAIHDPHAAGTAPASYPEPLIGHREGRERALAAGRAMRADPA